MAKGFLANAYCGEHNFLHLVRIQEHQPPPLACWTVHSTSYLLELEWHLQQAPLLDCLIPAPTSEQVPLVTLSHTYYIKDGGVDTDPEVHIMIFPLAIRVERRPTKGQSGLALAPPCGGRKRRKTHQSKGILVGPNPVAASPQDSPRAPPVPGTQNPLFWH